MCRSQVPLGRVSRQSEDRSRILHNIDLEVMQSGFGVKFWSGESSENCPQVMQSRFGVNFDLGPANFRKIVAKFLSEFFQRFFSANCLALFLQGFRPPRKFTPKLHAQDCRHSSPISHFEPNFFHAAFLLMGDIKNIP